jgi:inhibitor of KinA sporulation pathway (predicted exonuclease)
VVDTHEYKILDTQSILVKPQRSKISNFCTKLTTLTQEQVDTGLLFQEACEKLREDFKSHKRMWLSWGDFDKNIFEKNCADYQCKYPFIKRHLNLKNCFALLHGLSKELGMDAALKMLNIPLEGTHHRGDMDSFNISKILINTLRKFRNRICIYNSVGD